MIFIKPILSILVAFPLNYVQGLTPDGENVCLVTENYQQKVFQKEWKEVPKTTESWCWDISKGFKCKKIASDWEVVEVPRTVTRSKIVPKCCKGYEEDLYLDKCNPTCHYECINGNCTAPETCSCDPGFLGFKCDIPCVPGSWGGNCSEKCDCPNGEICDVVTGECSILTSTTEETMFTSDSDLVNEKETDLETTTLTTTTTLRSTMSTQSTFEEFRTTDTEKTTTEENLTTEESVATTLERDVISTTTQNIDEKITTTEKIEEINSTTQKTEETLTTTEENNEMTTTQTTEQVETSFQTSTEPVQTTTFTTPQSTTTTQDTTKTTVTEENFSTKEETEGETTTESIVYTTEISNTIDTDFYWKENEFTKNREIEDLTNNDTILNKQNKHLKIVHFMPSLTVLTGACILLFIIVTRYLIVRSRKRKQKLILENQEKFFPSQRSQNTDSIFTINNFGENPVYLSEEELGNKTPVLQTFKPLNVETNSPKTNETTFR